MTSTWLGKMLSLAHGAPQPPLCVPSTWFTGHDSMDRTPVGLQEVEMDKNL